MLTCDFCSAEVRSDDDFALLSDDFKRHGQRHACGPCRGKLEKYYRKKHAELTDGAQSKAIEFALTSLESKYVGKRSSD